MKLETERTIIRKPKNADFSFVQNLWLNKEVMNFIGFPTGIKASDKEISDWIKNKNPNRVRLIVENKHSGRPIAETGWQNDIDYPYAKERKSASLDIKILESFWGQGFGTEILKALIEYIFKNSDLEVLFVDPNVKNIGAIKLYEKIGFVKIGQLHFYTKNVQTPIKSYYYELEKK